MGDKDDNISLIEMRKCKILKNIKFGFEVNEMAWDPSGRVFLLTTGGGWQDQVGGMRRSIDRGKVDADQINAGLDQEFGTVGTEHGVVGEIGFAPPLVIPAGVEEDLGVV